MKIALVDDSVILRSAIKNVLNASGFQVVLEADGSAGLFAGLKESGAELVLLDLFFPKENGLDILSRLKKESPQIKVLIVTGLKQESLAEEAKRLGANDILYKPFDTDDLLRSVRELQE